MTTTTLSAPSLPHFEGLPRRKLAWSVAALGLWVLLAAGFVGSVSSLPEAVHGAGLAGGAVAEAPCPPTCSPAHG